LLKKKIKSPFIPLLNGEFDVSNFESEFTETSVYSYPNGSEDGAYMKDFEDFSFDVESKDMKMDEEISETISTSASAIANN